MQAYKYNVIGSYNVTHNKQYFIGKVQLVCVFILIRDVDLILCEYKTLNCNAFKGDFWLIVLV